MKNIIVTGGAGFIGSNLVKALNEKGYENIIIVDHLADNRKRNNLAGRKYVRYYDKKEFLTLIERGEDFKTDVVFHLGACSDTTETNEDYMISNNTVYSQKLFEYCIRGKARLIYASSAATYGDGAQGYSDDVFELKPLNLYGYSKHLFDKWVLSTVSRPPQCVGLKFFNVYGPNEYHKDKMASVIFHGYTQVKKEGKIKLFKSYRKDFKDGQQKRDFIYVKDVIKICLFFLDNGEKNGIFNVGTGKARTFLDLANSVFKSLNKQPQIKFIDMPESLKDKYQYFTEAPMNKIRQVGYKEKFYELEIGIEDYVKNYLAKLEIK